MVSSQLTLAIEWANTKWILDHRRVLIDPINKILILSDIHIGYYSSLRAQGAYLPSYDSKILNETVKSLLESYPGYHWIIAGDIKHNRKELLSNDEITELKELLELITTTCTLTVIIGNHDRGLEHLLGDLGIECSIHDKHVINDIIITHRVENTNKDNNQKFIIGHVHPVISSEFVKGHFIPVFALSSNVLILPAFNYVAGGYNIKNIRFEENQNPNFTIFAVGKAIYPLGLLENLK